MRDHVAKFAAGPWRSVILRARWLARMVATRAGSVPRSLTRTGIGKHEVHWQPCTRRSIRRFST